jgi:hypothetical protein
MSIPRNQWSHVFGARRYREDFYTADSGIRYHSIGNGAKQCSTPPKHFTAAKGVIMTERQYQGSTLFPFIR